MKGRIKEILHGAMAFFAEIEFRFPVTVQNSIMEFSLFSTFIKIILGGGGGICTNFSVLMQNSYTFAKTGRSFLALEL